MEDNEAESELCQSKHEAAHQLQRKHANVFNVATMECTPLTSLDPALSVQLTNSSSVY